MKISTAMKKSGAGGSIMSEHAFLWGAAGNSWDVLAYIASQRHEGWIAVADGYDDGGFSGGKPLTSCHASDQAATSTPG
jgi:hypothetical protein